MSLDIDSNATGLFSMEQLDNKLQSISLEVSKSNSLWSFGVVIQVLVACPQVFGWW